MIACRCAKVMMTNHNLLWRKSLLRPKLCKSLSSTTTSTANTTTEVLQQPSAAATAATPFPIFLSLVAAAAGILTVAATTAAVEASSSCPPYSPTGQRYDQSTFTGRFCKMILQCDPRLLLYTQAQVLQAKAMLDTYDAQNNNDNNDDDRALWEARRLVQSALNDKGEFIPQAFRMSGYVPYNGPVCVAMLAAQSTWTLLFWSWVNQSQNALVNYSNRNSSSSAISNTTLATSYGAAVGSALAVGFGLATWIQRRWPPAQAQQLLKFIAFPSAVVASSLNCYIMRSPELTTGVPLLQADGTPIVVENGSVATSQAAARQGVTSMVVSRAILPAPVFFGPPLALSVGPLRRYLLLHPTMVVPITTFVLLTSFGIGLPATVAIFPQVSSIEASAVEPEFAALIDPETQEPYNMFYYNKGL